jgi:uncharacterized protein (TIGR00299 family) protein
MAKTLHLETFSGIAGDMLVAALLGLGADREEFWQGLRSLPLPETWSAQGTDTVRNGFAAKRFIVEVAGHGHGHGHGPHARTLPEIVAVLRGGALPPRVLERAEQVFQCLAKAEASVHGKGIDHVHFHEVGAADAIIDIVGAVFALELLGVERLLADPPALGRGTIKTAHGILPVPAPATMALLQGKPVRPGGIEAELTTPTGAALLVALADAWDEAPVGRLLATACGAGGREIPGTPNVLRASLYETGGPAGAEEAVSVLECTLDDMPGEQFTWLGPKLLQSGAWDYAVIPVTMKKDRPGMILQVLCPPDRLDACTAFLLRETPTLGVRHFSARRTVLRREERRIATPWGEVCAKFAYDAAGRLLRIKPAADDCAALAERSGVSYEWMRQRLAAHMQVIMDEEVVS